MAAAIKIRKLANMNPPKIPYAFVGSNKNQTKDRRIAIISQNRKVLVCDGKSVSYSN